MASFKQYTASGGAYEAFSIQSFTSDEIKVRVDGVLKTAATHYNITSYTTNGGTVTWTSGNVPSGSTVRIYRVANIATPKATFAAGSSVKAGNLNDNQTQLLRGVEESQDQLIQTYDIEDKAVTTAKLAANSIQTLADQVTASEPDWLTNLGVVAGDLGAASDMGLVTNTASTVTSGNIDTVADNIASVNRYANEYKIASSAPGSPSAGDLWYDTGTNKLKFYDNSAWLELASGAIIDEDNMTSNSASRVPSQQSVKAYVDNLLWLDQSTKEDGSVIYWKNSSSKYFADNAQNIKTIEGGNF